MTIDRNLKDVDETGRVSKRLLETTLDYIDEIVKDLSLDDDGSINPKAVTAGDYDFVNALFKSMKGSIKIVMTEASLYYKDRYAVSLTNREWLLLNRIIYSYAVATENLVADPSIEISRDLAMYIRRLEAATGDICDAPNIIEDCH